MAKDRYPFERHSEWAQDLDSKRRFWEALEATGIDRVRTRLQEHNGGERSAINIGGCMMTKGYAQEWLAWYDRQKEQEKEQKQLKKEQDEAAHRTRTFRLQCASVIIGFCALLVAVGFLNWLSDAHWFNSAWVKLTSMWK
jgi:hypothetical protein